MMRLSLTIAAGTGKTPITTTIGTIRFTTASAILAATIRSSLATTTATALTPPALRSAMTEWVTRSAWRQVPSGSAAETWTRATARQQDTSSAWNGSLRLTPLNCTPNEGDPSKAPDITINSWGCPVSEGCTTGDELRVAVEAQEAAGIQMVVAAGNSGPSCSTVSDPPSFYDASYTVGALNTGTDTIASFSSLGPVTRDGSNRTKPDITAPGTNTRSCSNTCDSCYTLASGTSMATPHIAGAMALLWSAIPSLQHQIQPSRDALDNSAVFISSTQCGTAGPPNNVYGWGRVDIAEAVGTPGPTPSVSPTPVSTATPCGATTPTPTATATPTATVTV